MSSQTNNNSIEPLSSADFRIFLQQEFMQRCRSIPGYSLRKFAGSLHLDPTALSKILSGRRPVTRKMIAKLGSEMLLTPAQIEQFAAKRKAQDIPAEVKEVKTTYKQIVHDTFEVMSNWYYLAILELTYLSDFKADEIWVAQKFGISPLEVKIALRSVKLNMFENREGVKILRYIGKGQKVNQVPIHPVTGYHLGQYLDFMASKGRPIGPDDYLFQASKCSEGAPAKPLSHTALGYIVKKWARKVNLTKRITPHSARATFISSLLENGEDIYSVAQAVNHADVRTTARYDKRKQNFNKSPVFGLKFFA
jgi:site-specific recombinase XerC